MLKRCVALLIALQSLAAAAADDTLRVTMNMADSLFLKNNLMLLASKYNVSAQKALIQQARLWDNPNVYAELNLYNGQKKQFFDIGSTGEKVFAVNQLITLAGKRNNRIQLAKIDAEIAEFQFYDVMRTLKFQLRSSFYKVYYLRRIKSYYDTQIASLKETVDASGEQEKKGNLSLKEVIRLKALLYQFENDNLDYTYQLADEETTLQTLLQSKQYVLPQVSDDELNKYTPDKIEADKLYTMALENRADIKIQQKEYEYSQVNYRLEKSNAVPDLTVGGTYDQAGSYINNYTALTFGFNLPVLNRNQGNIRSAKYMVDYQNAVLQNTQLNLQNEINATVNKVIETDKLYGNIDKNFRKDFYSINDAVLENYQKRNISLVEFIDFYQTYLENISNIFELRLQRINAYEELNYNVGKELFK